MDGATQHIVSFQRSAQHRFAGEVNRKFLFRLLLRKRKFQGALWAPLFFCTLCPFPFSAHPRRLLSPAVPMLLARSLSDVSNLATASGPNHPTGISQAHTFMKLSHIGASVMRKRCDTYRREHRAAGRVTASGSGYRFVSIHCRHNAFHFLLSIQSLQVNQWTIGGPRTISTRTKT